MNKPTQRDKIRAMSLEEYAEFIDTPVEQAKLLRDTLYSLEKQGRVRQDENGNWWPLHS